MNHRIHRVEFARQLYNLLHLEVENDEDSDTRNETKALNDQIVEAQLKALNSNVGTRGTNQKRPRTDVSGGGRGGGGGQGTADSAELRAHGYEVRSQVIVDANGGTWEPLFKVWQPLSTY